ncbi:MAG: diguanylate cyclase [Firmicutes bacterium]|nr:diguanylate cyclase [Bacillota bacterium]
MSTAKKEPKFIKMANFLYLGWTLFLAVLLIWNFIQIKDSVQKEALITLRMTLDRDLAFRAWATGHGGVYIPVGPQAEPNPYLAHLEDRDLFTEDGKELTLFNPAYIMRQVYEADRENWKGAYGRLVSLQPVNPANAADPWEKEALHLLEKDSTKEEISTVTTFNDESAVRLITPFYIEEGCLKCHGDQGYELGDLRGGVSASRPFAPYAVLMHSRRRTLILGYSIIWLVGLGGIGIFQRKINISARDLKEKEVRNRAMVDAIPDLIFHYSQDGVYLDLEIKDGTFLSKLAGKDAEAGFIGTSVADLLPPKIAKNILAAIEKVVATGEMEVLEHALRLHGEKIYLEERLVLEGEAEVISLVRDITAQKELEARLTYLSFHDELTGLYNRNYFENELKRFNQGREYPISIIYADINDLKKVNDTLGHSAGDRLLRDCAQVLRHSLRKADLLARVGGDEFVAILPRTGEKEAQKIVERIKTNLADYLRKEGSLPLGLALGLKTAATKDDDLVLTCKKADDLMYREKLRKRKTPGP